jgi:5-methylcytosine-specific restriction endonuclease McrA
MGKRISDMTPEEIEHQREYGRKYHKENKEAVSQRKRSKRIERYRQLVEANNSECSDCGISDMPDGFFDFHHIDPSKKERSISAMLSSAKFDKVLEELQKCVMLCPNCHRKRHIETGHYFYARKG